MLKCTYFYKNKIKQSVKKVAKMISRNFIGVLCVFYYFYCVVGQQIEFRNGRYTGIVIGIDGNITSSECTNIRRSLELILPEFSKSLQEATLNKSGIGQVVVLLPSHWDLAQCELQNVTILSSTLYSYDASHVQITERHPLASTLPWTKQYKPCMQSGDSIIVPLSFLTNSSGLTLSNSIKGKVLLAEWAKFRYGVFDEIGYATGREDSLFPACYSAEKQAYLTACSSVVLPAIAAKQTACSIDFLMKNQGTTVRYMGQGSTSVLSAPYIDQSSTNYFCDDSTHNPFIETKQNFYCSRQSVSKIVNQHRDFRQAGKTQWIHQSPEVQIRYLKHEREFRPAFAFVIEDSPEMHDSYKLQHVKQAIAQFLDVLDYGVEVQIIIHSEDSVISSKANELNNDIIKRDLLNSIPDILYSDGISISNTRQLQPVIDFIATNISAPKIYDWNVFLFSPSANGIVDMTQAVESFKEMPYKVSIVTFDDGQNGTVGEWLKWYGIANTDKIITLPYCKEVRLGPCDLRTSSLIMEHLTSSLNNQKYGPRLLQKVAHEEVKNAGGSSATFQLNAEGSIVKNMYFYMSIAQQLTNPGDYVELISPSGVVRCLPEAVFQYGFVLKFTEQNCAYQAGQWQITMKSYIPPDWINLHFDVFLEYDTTVTETLSVVPSLGVLDLSKELPTNEDIIPVYVSVTTKNGDPILDAGVILNLIHPGLLEGLPPKTISLTDNGDISDGADQTGNDGVYSAYLSGYSDKSASFHLGQVSISINRNSKILNKIRSPNPTLLNEQMLDKCCGKDIHALEFTEFQHLFHFQTFLPGFKLLEPSNRTFLQPGTIGKITELESTDTEISIQFMSVRGDLSDDTIQIESFQACCIPKNSTEGNGATPTEVDCKPDTTQFDGVEPEPPGSLQTVRLIKSLLVDKFISREERPNVDFLMCLLRVVNSASAIGGLSQVGFEVDVTAITRAPAGGASGEPECKSIKDKCLPILIFWILISCVALLVVLLLFVIIICCWCRARDKKESVSHIEIRRDNIVRENVEEPSRLENNNMSVKYSKEPSTSPNNANFPRDKDEPKVVKELFVNHAYIQDGDGEIKIIADSGEILRKPLNNANPHEPAPFGSPRFKRNIPSTSREPPVMERQVPPQENMQIFKPVPNPKPLMPKHPTNQRRLRQRPEIVHPNPMLRSDSTQEFHAAPVSPTSPTRQDPTLVYATISRAGRLRPPNEYSEQSTPTKVFPADPHYMVPLNSLPKAAHRSQGPNPRTPQVQPYPSSDSDSSMPSPVRNQRRPPRFTKPPPYPAGSQYVNRPPSGQSSTGGGMQMQTNLTRPISSSPPALPPVPPPRFERSVRGGGGNVVGPAPGQGHNYAPKQSTLTDEDSDQWDDGDNFDFNQGDSYA